MPRVILAEDSRTQAAVIRFQLEDQGFEVQICGDGTQALRAVEERPPDLVLTDLDMPEMDGVGLVAALKRSHPGVPVLIMHTAGSEAAATAALKQGAAGYVFKKDLPLEIGQAYQRVLQASSAGTARPLRAPSLPEAHLAFVLDNDLSTITPVVAQVRAASEAFGLLDENDSLRFGIAVAEAIRNAMDYGNLELATVPFELAATERESDSRQGRLESAFGQRRVRVRADLSPAQVSCVIEHDGRAMNACMLEASPKLNLEQQRVLTLIQSFVDQVGLDPTGRQLTLVKQRQERV